MINLYKYTIMKKYSIVLHGGCGLVSEKGEYIDTITRIVSEASKLLEGDVAALDAVEFAVQQLENEPIFNAGKGSVFTHEKTIEMDAGIMDGSDLSAGAIAGVKGIRNPISLARTVKEKSKHVFMIGEGAMSFASENGYEFENQEYFETAERKKQLEEALVADAVILDHSGPQAPPREHKLGTVGAVAYDQSGHIAAATSTGGIVNKRFGRVGDTPIIGAGVYANNKTCGVSATGFGEQFLRTVLAKSISDNIKYTGNGAMDAAQEGINELVRDVNGQGGVIVIDHTGEIGFAHSTPQIICAGIKSGGEVFHTL
jgi:L-asparaginase / beta-aspartyl-peptidase